MKNIFLLFYLICSFAYAQLPSNIPTDGLIGYWPLDGNANDVSGNQNNGTVYGASVASDRFGNPNKAYSFSVNESGGWGAAQNRIVVPNPTIPNNNSFTMSAWVNLETKPSPFNNRPHSIMGRWDSNGDRVFRYQIKYSGEVHTQLYSGGNNYSHTSGNVSYDDWTHVVSTYDGSVLKHYINGVLVGQETLDITLSSSSTNLTFGEIHMSNGHWYLFNGEMDDLGYWSRALTENEVVTIYDTDQCSEVSVSASATEVCAGEEVTINVNNLSTGTTQSCYGSTNQIFADWTELAPNAEYVNIIKHNDIYYLRSNNDVLQSDNINGSWVSMNFQNQIGHQCSPIATLFDFDWADRLQVATLHNSLYAYENGNWINNGLSGYGCSGRALTRLANNRIIVSKWGYLRDLYISDDNGSNWTNVTNVNNDYRDIIVADNGTVFACGGSNTASMTGLIKSTDNGNSFFNISSELGINYASTLSDDCEGNLYVLAENNIYKSTDEGENWTLFSNTPFNSTVTYSFLLPTSSDVLFLFGRNANEIGLYESNNGGATWHELTNPLSDLNTIRELKLIDNVLVILSDEGVFGKTVEFSTTTYLWSTGDTTATISVTPTETTEYWVDVTTNGVTCREYVTINVTAPVAPTGDSEQTFCDMSTLADLAATGDNIQWYDAATGGNLLDSTTALADGQMVYASQTVNGCESTDRLEVTVSIQDITITASATEVCAGDSVDLGVTYPQQFNSWTHMVAVYNLDTDLLYFYINGVLSATSDISGIGNIFLTGGGSESRKIGQRAYSNHSSSFFWGYIDDVGVWDKPLSNIQVTDLYENQNICQVSDLPIELQSDLIAYYPFCNSLVDIGGGHNGTNFGATASTDRFGNENSSFHFDGTSYVSIPTSLNLNNTSGGWTLSAWANPDFIANNIPNANYILDLTDGTANNNWGDRTALGLVENGYRTGCHADNNISASYGVTAPFATPPSILWSTSDTTETISVTPTETTEYWVDVTTNGVTCREYVTINVTSPAAPTGNPVQGGCSDFTVGSNNNTFTGENLQWYSTPSGGTALPESHLLVDGTYYYISQTVDGCESSDRFEFLYLAPDPTITIDSPVICEGDSTTVSVSSSPSLGTATFLWNTGETSESITLSPTESTTFWVDQIYNSGGPENIQTVCRYFFGITVDNAPDAPVSGGDITECETVAAQSLVATASANSGESITWYDAATGGSIVVDPSLSAAGTVTYYAEATNDTSGCASLSRTAVALTITSIAAPTGESVQSFCDNVIVSDLSASGSNIQWYDAATGGNVLDPSSTLSDGQVLYASQTENSCESITRLEVSVEIDIIPDPILITTELEFCLAREATLVDLEVDEQGFALEWYDSFSGGNMLPMDTILEDGVSYYATLYDAISGCESLMRLEVVPTVIPCEVVIYNAISLNDNGINDYMVIENAEYFPDNSLEVYNRDGHLLYSQTQYGIGDNLFRGVANVSGIYGSTLSGDGPRLPTGSYLYVFKYFNPYEQQQYTLKGFLTINSN